jgi:hypothetical protein
MSGHTSRQPPPERVGQSYSGGRSQRSTSLADHGSGERSAGAKEARRIRRKEKKLKKKLQRGGMQADNGDAGAGTGATCDASSTAPELNGKGQGLQVARLDKPLVLFDLNGVLVSERACGGARRDTWDARPGIEALLELAPRCVVSTRLQGGSVHRQSYGKARVAQATHKWLGWLFK